MPRCPLCKTLTDLIKYEGVPIHNCGTCGGHWLTDAKLNVIVSRREIVMPPAVQHRMLELANTSDSAQELWCLTCGTAMRKVYFRNWPQIRLDRCPKCDGLWLDRGELEKCQIYWEYIKDHPDCTAAQLTERLAILETRLAQQRAELQEQTDRRDVAEAVLAATPLGAVQPLLDAVTGDTARAVVRQVLSDLFTRSQEPDAGAPPAVGPLPGERPDAPP